VALKRAGGRCECCGRGRIDAVLHVDHIKPRSRFPWLALDPNNVQVLCDDCNMGKGTWDFTDWRSRSPSPRSADGL
jgi:5-methylcytosine-specific restriction endonuclease McrA